jgi:hypothetical protein
MDKITPTSSDSYLTDISILLETLLTSALSGAASLYEWHHEALTLRPELQGSSGFSTEGHQPSL